MLLKCSQVRAREKKRALAAGLDPMRMLPRTGLRAADTLVSNPKATTPADAVAYRAYGLGPKLWPLDRFIDAVDDRPQRVFARDRHDAGLPLETSPSHQPSTY